MSHIVVAGIGTGVGKTVVSSILTYSHGATYWKPIECGPSDTKKVKMLVGEGSVLEPIYRFKRALFPPACEIELEKISIPTQKRLIIEMCGGILVPLSATTLTVDLFSTFEASWVIVSKHYLGSINHTLMTVEALKRRKIPLLGIIFNGCDPEKEKTILSLTKIPLLGHLHKEKEITLATLTKYRDIWSGTLTPR